MAEFSLYLPDSIAGILGSVDEQGILTFAIHAQPESPIRGTELFDLMMRAFGNKVRGVLGIWRRGSAGSPSVNLDRVNERTAGGVPLRAAVEQTWTFSRAARWGFSRVVQVDAAGTPGNYTKIDVLLGKVEVPQ